MIATWKILVALAGGTTLYTIYSIGATILAFELDLPFICKIGAPFATWAGLPLIGYFALKFGEVGVDVYKYGQISAFTRELNLIQFLP